MYSNLGKWAVSGLWLLLLTGCAYHIKAPPYMQGTFVGFYLTDEDAAPVGIRLDTTVHDVSETRYTFSGTATIGSQTYTVEGYEEGDPHLTYTELAPQVYIPLVGLVANFVDAEGTVAYALCAYVRYDVEPYRLEAAALYEEPCGPRTRPSSEFAAVYIERFERLGR